MKNKGTPNKTQEHFEHVDAYKQKGPVLSAKEVVEATTGLRKPQSHTPGPWEIVTDSEDPDYVVVDGPCGIEVADCCTANGEPDNAVVMANARLIAAAPTMKDALLRIRKALNQNPKAAEDALRDDPQAWDALNAAIESAGGF